MYADYQINAGAQEVTATFVQKRAILAEETSLHNQETVNSINNKELKRTQFPFPKSDDETESIICDHNRVMKIYNKYHNATRKKLTGKIAQWFLVESKRHGWAYAEFIKNDGSTRRSCILIKNTNLESYYVEKH